MLYDASLCDCRNPASPTVDAWYPSHRPTCSVWVECSCPRGAYEVYVGHHRTICLGQPETFLDKALILLAEVSEMLGGDLPDKVNDEGWCRHSYHSGDEGMHITYCIHYRTTQLLKAVSEEYEKGKQA